MRKVTRSMFRKTVSSSHIVYLARPLFTILKMNELICPQCKKVFSDGDTVAIDQHKTEGCNICSYRKKGISCFIPLIPIKLNLAFCLPTL